MFAATTFWAACIDVTDQFTGSLSGLMNTFGNFGGWLSPIVSAYVATRFGWNRALDCAAVVSIASALFFLLVRADQKVDTVADDAPTAFFADDNSPGNQDISDVALRSGQ